MAFMIGGIASCFLWGALADNLGRKKTLYRTHLADAVITMVCAVMPGFRNLLVLRFLNGFLIGKCKVRETKITKLTLCSFLGAPGSIIFTYVAEFQPLRYRTPVVCFCGVFFTIAWLILPLLAYIVLPLKGMTFIISDLLFFSPWRLFLIILAVPELLTGLWILKMPESPKFFLAQGSHKECLDVLKQMYSLNTGEHVDTYPVKYLIADKVEPPVTNRVACSGKTMRVFNAMGEQVRSLFRKPLLVVTGLTCSIMFANMFG